jgi:predicted acylesterase/phospholipase RssA
MEHPTPPSSSSLSTATAEPVRGSNIDLAFSGGGVRAALFAVGVVLYLIRSGIRTRVASISSVSGGSITNAVLAGHNITEDEPRVLEFVLRRFAVQLAMRGSFFGAAYRRAAQVGLVLVGGTGALYLAMARNILVQRGGQAGALGWLQPSSFQLLVAVIMPTVVVAYLVSSRGRRQRAIYRRFLRRVMPAPTRRHDDVKTDRSVTGQAIGHLRRGPQLRELPATNVTHVFCATELTSGGPIFISRDWIYCPAYGCGTSTRLALADAVYASAAFPLVFPPLLLKVNSSEWSGGDLAERPSVIRLADGGICNNLGTDWRKAVRAAASSFEGWDTERAQLPTTANQILVVNASAPPRLVNIKGLGPLKSLREFHRMISVMFENTLRPRLERMDYCANSGGEILIDIAETPVAMAHRIQEQSEDVEVKKRAGALLEKLNTRSHSYWAEYNKQAAQVRTTLDSVGVKQAAQLVRHGYLSATVACHSYLDSAGLESVPNDRWFTEFFRD